jgi:arylsulfatase A-like enzyme
MIKNFFVIFSTALFFVSCSNSTGSERDKPNVILVMTDDQGYGELSFHGNPVLKTPNLDQLARQSLRFVDYHAAPMCTPTRGQLMTGMDAARNGAINVSSGRALLRPDLKTMADIFSENGYRTGIFGKWHLGDNYPFRPQDRGFQETLWFPSSHIGSASDYWGNDYFDDTYIRNGKRQKFEGYCTDIFFDEAMEFIRKSVQAGKPFFAYLPTNTPHSPLNAKEEDIKAMEAAFAASELSSLDPVIKDKLVRYLGMVRNIDTNMGRLEDFLEKEGLRENTIVIFTTDNGSTRGPLYYNAGMRGMKTELWEGGHRVPCFISWPAGGFTAPRYIEGLTEVQDILPTLVELCQLDRPASTEFDGISLAPVLRGESQIPEDRIFVINFSRIPARFNYPSPYSQSVLRKGQGMVLWKRWRLLEDRELYNLEDDPLQQNNVIDQYPEVVNKMRSYMNDWWEGVKDIANVPRRIIIGHEKENPTMLSSCEWLDVFVDQQRQVIRGPRRNGYWCLEVAEAGEYEFELRRWPREIDTPLTGVPPSGGTALPIATARLFISNVNHLAIGDKIPYEFEGLTKPVKPGQTAVTFSVKLEPGPMALHTWFDDENGETICGAYYVYVTRK